MIVKDQLKDLEGVEHLHGNLFRVSLDKIQFAENGDSDGLTFCNPRHILGTNKPKGFSKEEMAELREAIRTEGLKDALRLRFVEVDGEIILQVVDGERRTRCVQKLVKDDEECYDPACEDWKNASELYAEIDCRINNMDDQTAFKHAFSGNERAIGIGEGATIALIREFRNAGWVDDQIMQTTGKSITWLKDTDTLIGLDEQTFTALTNDKINRSAALDLANIEDVEERMSLLDTAFDFAKKRLSSVKKRLEKEVDSTENKLELAEAEAVEAELGGDDEGKTKAEAKAARLKSKAKTKKKEAAEIESDDPKVNTKDLQKAKGKVKKEKGGDTEPPERLALTRNKIEKFYYTPVLAIIKSEGMDEDGEPLEVDVEDARLVKLVCEGIEKGETDIGKILTRHLKAKEKRAG